MNMQPSMSRPPIMSERRVGLLGALFAAIGPVSMSLYTPAMPEIVTAFGTTEAAVKMSLSLYFAGFAFAQLFCGPISDGVGRRPVTVAFMTIYTGASILAVTAWNIDVLILARFLQGIGAAVGVAMSRAIVRDLFEHEQSARIMNMIGIILAVGPAAAPTIGGVTMELAGWHAIFLVMAVAGIGIALAAIFLLRETVERDLSRIRPRQLLRNYVLLVSTPYFMTASLMNAGATGALYALATILPFVLMGPIALTPTQFGASMTIQSFSYLFGSLALRFLMPRFGAFRLVPVGLVVMACGATAMALVPHIFEPGFLLVMAPVGVYAFGIAFITAAMTTAAMAPFPRNAGSAAAMIGFMQMGAGLLGGTVAALIGDPVLAFTTVVPCLALMSIVSWLIWRRLPEPEMATPVSQPVVLE
jgi:DHA1 family bicyclomycin/chloramphenicol resistance-like MFS transporter